MCCAWSDPVPPAEATFAVDTELKLGKLAPRVFFEGTLTIDWDPGSFIAWSGSDRVEVGLENRITYKVEGGYEVPYEIRKTTGGSDDLPVTIANAALDALCGKNVKLKLFKKVLPLNCELVGVATMTADVTGRVKHTYASSGTLFQSGRKVLAADGKATGKSPRYRMNKQGGTLGKHTGEPSVVAKGSIQSSVGVAIKFFGGKEVGGTLGLQQKLTFGFDYAAGELGKVEDKRPTLEVTSGIALEADLELDLELVKFDTWNVTFFSFRHELADWLGEVTADELDTTEPLYTVDQVRDAMPDTDEELARGFDFLIGDPEFGCPHVAGGCAFDDMTGKAAYVYADRRDPTASFAMVPIVYDSADTAREAVKRLERELAPFDGEFEVDGTPEAATQAGLLLTVRMEGSGKLGPSGSFLDLPGAVWDGKLLEMRYREVPSSPEAFQIAMGRAAGNRYEVWVVQASHNLVLKARVAGTYEADWKPAEIAKGLTVPLTAFVDNLAGPQG